MEKQTKTRNVEARETSLHTKIGRGIAIAGAIAMLGGAYTNAKSLKLYSESYQDTYSTHLPANHYRESSWVTSDIQNPMKKYKRELVMCIRDNIGYPFLLYGGLILGLGLGVVTTPRKYELKEKGDEK